MKTTLRSILKEGHEELGLSTPKRTYRHTRKTILVDGFDREAIRRKIYLYEIYNKKEHVTIAKLLVRLHTWLLENV
jgi:hypothetical protein